MTEETVNQIFAWILEEVNEAGYLNAEAIFIDGTHIKANANIRKQYKEEIPVAAKRYADELMEEINADRESHGKKPFDDTDNNGDDNKPAKKKKDNTSKKKQKRRKKAEKKTVTKSTTDPDCRLFVKGKQKKQFAYEAIPLVIRTDLSLM